MMKKINYLYLIIFCMFSFFVLNTYYFYSIGFPIVQCVGLIFLIHLYYICGINKKKLYNILPIIVIFLLLVIGTSIINLFLIEYIALPITLIGVILGFIIFMFTYASNIPTIITYKVLTSLTIILLFFWFLQFVGYYVFNEKLDFFIDIVGYKQRTYLGIGKDFFRPSSLFLEPAMYVNSMLLLFYYRLKLVDFKIDKLNLLIVFSIVFTFSSYGYIAFGVLGLLILIARQKIISILILFLLIVVVILYFLPEIQSNLILNRLLNPLAHNSGNVRLIGTIMIFLEQNIFHLLFGFGLGNAEVNGLNGSSMHFLIYNTGIVGLFSFIIVIYFILINKKYKYITMIVFLLSLLNNSSAITSFFNWAILGFIFSQHYTKVQKKEIKYAVVK